MDNPILDVKLDPMAELATGRRTAEIEPYFKFVDQTPKLQIETPLSSPPSPPQTGWQELHCIAWSIDDLATLPSWFAEWDAVSVPCGNCRIHWEDYKQKNPPDFGSRAGFFWWSWRAHNTVSLRIGKTVWSLKRAHRHYHPGLHQV